MFDMPAALKNSQKILRRTVNDMNIELSKLSRSDILRLTSFVKNLIISANFLLSPCHFWPIEIFSFYVCLMI